MRSLRFLLVVCLAIAFASVLARGQGSVTGTITGQVSDPSGAVIAGAEVTITDTSTGFSQTVPTNPTGSFLFASVKPGTYNVTVKMKGFRTLVVPGQRVSVGQQLNLSLSMSIGTAAQTVEVTSTAGAELQTINSTMGTTLSGTSLLMMTALSRDVTSVLIYQPATAPTFGGVEGNTTGGQVAGSLSDQNTFTLDGGNATDDLAGDNNYIAGNRGYYGPQSPIPIPLESIEELRVATNNQTADFSTSAGGQVMLSTKRGSNQWHGSGYDFFQADWLDAAGWNADVVGAKKVKQHQNRFGGSVGGPMLPGEILGGKTYFYFNYEGRRYPYSNARFERTVPSDLLRQGILQFRDTQGNIVAYDLKTSTQCGPEGNQPCDPRGIGLNPVINQLWSQYEPEPNDCEAYGDHLNTCGYFGSLRLPINDNFAVGRIDHDFGSKWRFMTSYRYYKLIYPSTNQVDIGGLIKGDTKGVLASQSSNPAQPRYAVAGLTGSITPNVTNDFRISYLRNDWNWLRAGVPTGLFGIPGGLEVGGETTNPLAPMNFDTQDARFRTWNGHDWNYSDTVSWLKGKHFFQIGGSYIHWWDTHVRPDNVTGSLSQLVYQINKASGMKMTAAYQPPACAEGGTNCILSSQLGTWNNLYAETLGFVGTAQQLFVRGGNDFHLTGAPYLQDHSITKQYNIYFNDSFKVTPTLTVNYGLAWGVQMPPYELNGIQDILTDSAGNPISYNSFIDNVQTAAAKGQVYNPVLGFEPISAVGGHPKYPFEPYYGGLGPRISVAYSPKFDSGVLGKLFGNSKTVLRGGFARIYDRSNAVNLVMSPLLGYGFGQPIRCNGARMDGVCTQKVSGTDPTNGFRIGVDGNTAPFPEVSQTLPIPAEPGINSPAASVLFGLDNRWRPGTNDEIDFSIQRELPGQMIMEVGYVGKWSKHIYLGMDNNSVPYMMKLGGQTFAQAYYNVWQADHNGTAAAPQPFFETALAGSSYCGGYSSCTAAVQANEGSAGTSNITLENPFGAFADIDGSWNFPGCAGCAILPTTLQGYAGLDMSTTNGYSNYQAMIFTVQKRTGHGLSLNANLTWSHTISTIGINQEYVEASPNNIYDLRYDYAPAPFDHRWVSNIVAHYEFPFGKGKRFLSTNSILDKVVGGWTLTPAFTWATGLPIETYTGSGQEFGGGYIPWWSGAVPLVNTGNFGHSARMNVSTDGVIGVNNDPKFTPGATGGNLFANPTAVYNNYRPALLGLDTRAYDEGPYYGLAHWNLDFTLAKETKITERVGATFMASFANALNAMQYGNPGMNLQDPANWGTLTGQYNNPRVIELGLRISF